MKLLLYRNVCLIRARKGRSRAKEGGWGRKGEREGEREGERARGRLQRYKSRASGDVGEVTHSLNVCRKVRKEVFLEEGKRGLMCLSSTLVCVVFLGEAWQGVSCGTFAGEAG